MPLGAPILWPETLIRSQFHFFGVSRTRQRPCTASMWNSAFGAFALSSFPSCSTGCTVPISLLTSWQDSSTVSSVSASLSTSGVMCPVASGARNTTSKPLSASCFAVLMVAACSISVTMMRPFLWRLRCAAPCRLIFVLSVPQAVK